MTRSVTISIAAICILHFATTTLAQDTAPLVSDSVVAMSQSAEADAARERQQFRSLDEDVQALKKEVLDLNRDLFLLEKGY